MEDDENEQDDEAPSSSRHGARNQHKAKIIVQWLQQTFPSLQNVLDVCGGGRAELAVRMALCVPGTTVTVVDPRPPTRLETCQSRVIPKLPKKWQQRLWTQEENRPGFLRDLLEDRIRHLELWWTEETVRENAELQAALQDCDVVVGIHSDGATELLIDVALAHGKPFCVMPCCVFPNFFPQRRLTLDDGSGKPVRSYEDFCQYLLQKDERLQSSVLGFPGRNVAIWWKPS